MKIKLICFKTFCMETVKHRCLITHKPTCRRYLRLQYKRIEREENRSKLG